ncbi:hypothetical protein CFOL_v3_24885 [Cephalotus follicularis]|uniref:Secreted protein n=1 Tax=Cephalotus follicularis TaxID=3775 RepID=A0A1Q3CMF1_CEPFO|nr:hypothetical protein CFOL_v3_24885 [Cephalotus follicularis]
MYIGKKKLSLFLIFVPSVSSELTLSPPHFLNSLNCSCYVCEQPLFFNSFLDIVHYLYMYNLHTMKALLIVRKRERERVSCIILYIVHFYQMNEEMNKQLHFVIPISR